MESNFRGENSVRKGVDFLIFYLGEDEIFVSVRKRNFNFGEKNVQTRFGRGIVKSQFL